MPTRGGATLFFASPSSSGWLETCGATVADSSSVAVCRHGPESSHLLERNPSRRIGRLVPLAIDGRGGVTTTITSVAFRVR